MKPEKMKMNQKINGQECIETVPATNGGAPDIFDDKRCFNLRHYPVDVDINKGQPGEYRGYLPQPK